MAGEFPEVDESIQKRWNTSLERDRIQRIQRDRIKYFLRLLVFLGIFVLLAVLYKFYEGVWPWQLFTSN